MDHIKTEPDSDDADNEYNHATHCDDDDDNQLEQHGISYSLH